MNGGEHSVQSECGVGKCPDGGEDDRKVFGLATGHHRIGGKVLDGGFGAGRIQHGDDLVRITPSHHGIDAGPGGRHHRQAVGPIEFETLFDLVVHSGQCSNYRGNTIYT